MKREKVKLAVIGGGISGLGIAWEAASRGITTTLLESKSLARATSDNSLRIIHGGFRYLQQLDLPRVSQSIKDQKFMLDWAADVVKPLPCLMPLRKMGLKSALPAWCGAQLYNAMLLAYSHKTANAKIISSKRLKASLPAQADLFPYGALHWGDALCSDPALLAEKVRKEAIDAGAEIREESPCLKVLKREDGFAVFTPAGELHAQVVVNATGPWLRLLPLEGITPLLRPCGWCKAFNIVFKKSFIEQFAVGSEDASGRLLFLVPRDGGSALGTEYHEFNGDPGDVRISEEEIASFVARAKSAFPLFDFNAAIEKVECGILPVRAKRKNSFSLYSLEQIASSDGYIEVLSAKYTAFRSQAKKVVEIASI